MPLLGIPLLLVVGVSMWAFQCQDTMAPSSPTGPLSESGSTPSGERDAPTDVAQYTFKVVAKYPHDDKAYTQGLAWSDGTLYEGTGRYGISSVRAVDLKSGKVLARHSLHSSLFGEGLAAFEGRLFQLTWHAERAFVYDQKTLEHIGELPYAGKGWGLTTDGLHLIQSDGSSTLIYRNPETFKVVRKIQVHTEKGEVDDLNELEFVEGEIFANIWKDDRIVRIDPRNGQVLGWIDLEGLFNYQRLPDPESVLNGIAYDPQGKRLFVTGKLWPHLFHIEILPHPDPLPRPQAEPGDQEGPGR